jgi:plasmid stability protein
MTLNLDDDLLRTVKRRAADTGQTMTDEPFELRWVTYKGKLRPEIDLTDRVALYDLMEDR